MSPSGLYRRLTRGSRPVAVDELGTADPSAGRRIFALAREAAAGAVMLRQGGDKPAGNDESSQVQRLLAPTTDYDWGFAPRFSESGAGRDAPARSLPGLLSLLALAGPLAFGAGLFVHVTGVDGNEALIAAGLFLVAVSAVSGGLVYVIESVSSRPSSPLSPCGLAGAAEGAAGGGLAAPSARNPVPCVTADPPSGQDAPWPT